MTNPQLAVRVGEDWVDLYQHLGQRLIEAHGRRSVRAFFERIRHAMARREGVVSAPPMPEAMEPSEPGPDSPAVTHQTQGKSAQLDLFTERD